MNNQEDSKTTLSVNKDIRDRLSGYGRSGDNVNDVIKKMLNYIDAQERDSLIEHGL